MDFSLDRIRSACNESKHSEITKMLTLSSQNESFVIEAFDRYCSICINMFLWTINFDRDLVLGSKRFSPERRDNLLLRIEFFVESQEHIQALLDAFREERFKTLKSIFSSNEFATRNFAFQLALERELKEGKSDALLLFLQWEERLAKNYDVRKLFTEIDPGIGQHFYVVSKLCKFMLRFDLFDAEPLIESQQKKLKLDEKLPFVSEIYEHLKFGELVIAEKWFERKDQTPGIHTGNVRNSNRAYFLLNYPSLIDEAVMEGDNGESVFEYVLSTPDVGISVEILRKFVKAKPSIVRWTKERTGDTMLHVYVKARTCTAEIVRFMIEELGLDPLQENEAKDNALETFLIKKWSENEISKSFDDNKEILEYLEAKGPLNGAKFIQKFSIFHGYLMVYQAAHDESPNQQFFLQYAMEKFYGPEVNRDYSMIERFKKFYGPNLYEKSTHICYDDENDFYDVVALLHSNFDKDIFSQSKNNILCQNNSISFIAIHGAKNELIEKLYDESDEDLKLFFEIIMKLEMIFVRFCGFESHPKILYCLPPYDENSKEGFKKKHVERMIRVFNELISERNNACATIQEAIEKWLVEQIARDISFKDDYVRVIRDMAPFYIDEEKDNRLIKNITQSGLLSALYSFTCEWVFTLCDEDASNLSNHYEEMKIFLGKSELFIPGSLYPQKGDVFSLKHLCRLEIRQMLIKDGPRDITSYVEVIESLGLPKKMENYIRYLPEC